MHHHPAASHAMPHHAARDHWHELEVHNASFTFDRFGGDCGDLQVCPS